MLQWRAQRVLRSQADSRSSRARRRLPMRALLSRTSEAIVRSEPPRAGAIRLDQQALRGSEVELADDILRVEQVVHEQRDIERAFAHADAGSDEILLFHGGSVRVVALIGRVAALPAALVVVLQVTVALQPAGTQRRLVVDGEVS